MTSSQFIAFLSALAAAATGNAAEWCAVLFETPGSGIERKVLESFSVERLAPDQPFALPPDTPQGVKSIQCGREALVLGPNDHKPLHAGYPLSIVVGGRVGVLEAVNGQLLFRMLKGKMTDQEAEQAGAALNAAQERFDDQSAPYTSSMPTPDAP
ncbi:MAG TPA: hypothetical protein VMQ83_07185 [Gammaproteobacteria bacterium]|nr:hypothetical protein [Gammaproteobacteria bacterium]